MSRLMRNSGIAVLVSITIIMCSACNAAGKPQLPAVSAELENKAEPVVEKTIAVEAYLVQVSMDALYKAGVKPVPVKGSDEITSAVLLKCISDPTNGKVISAGRIVTKDGDTAETNTTTKKNVKRLENINLPNGAKTENVRRETYQIYQNGCHFSAYCAKPNVKEKHQIKLNIEFDFNGYDEDKIAKEDTAPDTTSYNFKGELIVDNDNSVVVGGMQNGNKGLFLVVRAIEMQLK
jgi:hypothetical protein